MRIFIVLLMICTIDVVTSAVYTCDRRATCGCSKRPTVVLSKIIGGEPVNISNSWSWMVSLRRDGYHQCGASLITPLHVITAAHCVKDVMLLSRLSLNFGITNLSDVGQLRNVSKMYVHPNYDEGSYANDIAILRLDRPLDLLQSNLSTICLPSGSDFDLSTSEYPPAGADLVAIGWGAIEAFYMVPTQILQQVTVKSIARSDSICQNTINNDTVQFCAGLPEGGKDTCRGDSGGPLMLFSKRRWYLVGVTSYGEICGAEGLPGVYTRLAFYDAYIKDTLRADAASMTQSKQLTIDASGQSSAARRCRSHLLQFVFLAALLVVERLCRLS